MRINNIQEAIDNLRAVRENSEADVDFLGSGLSDYDYERISSVISYLDSIKGYLVE